jgi:hypothetical protein
MLLNVNLFDFVVVPRLPVESPLVSCELQEALSLLVEVYAQYLALDPEFLLDLGILDPLLAAATCFFRELREVSGCNLDRLRDTCFGKTFHIADILTIDAFRWPLDVLKLGRDLVPDRVHFDWIWALARLIRLHNMASH